MLDARGSSDDRYGLYGSIDKLKKKKWIEKKAYSIFSTWLKSRGAASLKVYIGMIAGVGKSYRYASGSTWVIDNGVDVRIGYIETHGRAGTEALLKGLPVILGVGNCFIKGKSSRRWIWKRIIQYSP